MPKGYVIFTEDIRDEAGMGLYAQQARPTIMHAGGRVDRDPGTARRFAGEDVT